MSTQLILDSIVSILKISTEIEKKLVLTIEKNFGRFQKLISTD